MHKISLALLLALGCSTAQADTVMLDAPKPPTVCQLGVLAIAKQVVADPKKIFGDKGGDPISALSENERMRLFTYTNLVTDAASKQETVCSISISVNPDLVLPADRAVLEKIYGPMRVQFKVTITGADQIVSPVSFKKIKSIAPE